jgi:hypothetical protein
MRPLISCHFEYGILLLRAPGLSLPYFFSACYSCWSVSSSSSKYTSSSCTIMRWSPSPLQLVWHRHSCQSGRPLRPFPGDPVVFDDDLVGSCWVSFDPPDFGLLCWRCSREGLRLIMPLPGFPGSSSISISRRASGISTPVFCCSEYYYAAVRVVKSNEPCERLFLP